VAVSHVVTVLWGRVMASAVWVATWSYVGNEFTYLDVFSSSKADFVLVATSGHDGPGFGVMLVVYGRSPRERRLRDSWVVRRFGSRAALVPGSERRVVGAGDVLLAFSGLISCG
jgi:hypothetical protein